MKGINFTAQKTVTPSAPNRMDIACFVGLVEYRSNSVAEEINQWLYEQGWLNSVQGYKATYHRDSATTFLDVPIPIESWEKFNSLFTWEQRKLKTDLIASSYLGAAVRSFFAQGGRKCYVVRVDNPLPLSASKQEREPLLAKIIPGFPGIGNSQKKSDRTSWHGIGHLLGLPDVSILCVPDLPDLVQADLARLPTESPVRPELPEQFVECSEAIAAVPSDNLVTTIPAPVSDIPAYQLWGNAIHQIARFIAQNRREVQLVVAIPLPESATPAASNLLNFMHQQSWLSGSLAVNESISSAFVQLCYPWLLTPGSQLLPSRLEPPDGAFAGMLARNALNRGAYRSATKLTQSDISGLFPELAQDRIYAKNAKAPQRASPNASLIDRVSLFGFVANGIGILSDVTTSNSIAHRPANINRIISLLVRALRSAGEDFVFEANGESLWADLKLRINDLLLNLYHLGALRGKQPEDAFYVRCDRSTMTQNDIDNGRVIAEVHIEPAATIESIDVILAMDQSGQVLMRSLGNKVAVA